MALFTVVVGLISEQRQDSAVPKDAINITGSGAPCATTLQVAMAAALASQLSPTLDQTSAVSKPPLRAMLPFRRFFLAHVLAG